MPEKFVFLALKVQNVRFSLFFLAENYFKIFLITEYFQIKIDLPNVRIKFLEKV